MRTGALFAVLVVAACGRTVADPAEARYTSSQQFLVVPATYDCSTYSWYLGRNVGNESFAIVDPVAGVYGPIDGRGDTITLSTTDGVIWSWTSTAIIRAVYARADAPGTTLGDATNQIWLYVPSSDGGAYGGQGIYSEDDSGLRYAAGYFDFCFDEPPYCGDGIVDRGEQCDDGNAVNTDACRNDCTLPYCGDGIVDMGEQCDDGNAVNTDACRNDCTLPYCGDGIVDMGEECDDGNANNDDGCKNDCTSPSCGIVVDKTCAIVAPPSTSYVCTKPINSISEILQPDHAAVLINAWYGAIGSSTLLASMQRVDPGEMVTITGLAGSPLDVYWEIFDAVTGVKLGVSTFHVSCSDIDMNTADDCGKPEGDGKGRTGFLNIWLFGGMSGGGQTLSCGDGGAFPSSQSCEGTLGDPPSCKSVGKAKSLTFEYTGNACPGTNAQGGKATCTSSGVMPDAASFTFLKDASKFTVTPSQQLTRGQRFTIATVGGADFPADIALQITGATGSQSLKIHTGCDVPLAVGDQFGALELAAFNGKYAGVAVTYGFRVVNGGDALGNVTLVDTLLGSITAPFALAPGETRELVVSGQVTGTETNEVVASGTLGGGAACEDTDSLTVSLLPPQGSCLDGHPTALTFRYRGGDCSTNNPQSGKFVCSGVAPTTGGVQVIATQNQSRLTITPSTQTIMVGDTFEVRRTDTLGAALDAETYLAVVQDGVTVQTLAIHTSCSQRLVVGDEFGSFVLVGFTPQL